MNWKIYPLPLDEKFIASLHQAKLYGPKEGTFFKGNFQLTATGDTYIDMSNYDKGVVYVNGHNLGRFWNVGPQFRLYCPASWLKKGLNEIVVFDLFKNGAATVSGVKTLKP
jgi:beta-galactosidase